MPSNAKKGLAPVGLISLVVAAVSAAGSVPAQQRMQMRMDPPVVSLPEGTDSIRVRLETSNNHVILPVQINGSEPLHLILDTGMPVPTLMLFDSPRVQALSLEYGPGVARVGGAGGEGHHIEARIAAGARVGLGKASLERVTVMVMPPIHGLSLEHDGVIGAAVFNNFTVHVDYDANEVVLTKPGLFKPSGEAVKVPLELKGNLPYVQASIKGDDQGDVPVTVVLDMGATHSVSLNATTEGVSVPPLAIATRIGKGVSGDLTGHVGRIEAFEIGGITLKNVVATFPDPEFENPRGMDGRDGNLGMDILRHFNITLDYAESVLYLEPNDDFNDPFEWEMSGLTLDPTEGTGLEVTQVVPGSPAAGAGLAEGDVLLTVNGETVTLQDRLRLRDLFMREGEEVSVEYKRGSDTESVRFRLRRLV